jgi:hypothetical protein
VKVPGLASWCAALAACAVLAASPAFAFPLGTGFTYQGLLNQSGSPVTGTVTLTFGLWDAQGGGTQIGASEVLSGITVTNGVFSVVLNSGGAFGPSAFTGDARWLQIGVCSDPGCSSSTTLAPRQPITAAPYSQFSIGPWQPLAGNIFHNGNVGIGTPTPHAPLELESGFGTEVLRFGLDAGDYHYLSTGFHGAQPYLNFLGFNIEHGSNDIRRVLTLQGDGSVGVGTSSPAAALDVRGDIKLGSSGQYFAPAAEENLRMVRGRVLANGVATAGCCYSVSKCGTGCYDITYNTAFSGVPSVTVGGEFDVSYSGFGPGSTPTASEIRVSLYFHDALSDGNFDFIAVGPR